VAFSQARHGANASTTTQAEAGSPAAAYWQLLQLPLALLDHWQALSAQPHICTTAATSSMAPSFPATAARICVRRHRSPCCRRF
jgi:hypothetical protein